MKANYFYNVVAIQVQVIGDIEIMNYTVTMWFFLVITFKIIQVGVVLL